jgi:hypothetical protein
MNHSKLVEPVACVRVGECGSMNKATEQQPNLWADILALILELQRLFYSDWESVAFLITFCSELITA